MVGADDNGNVDTELLKEATKVTVAVSHGEVDITNDCNYDWKLFYESHGYPSTFPENNDYDNVRYLTRMEGDWTNIEVEIYLKNSDGTNGKYIGKRTVPVKKIKSPATYKLVISPNAIPKGINTDVKIQVIKFCDGTRTFEKFGNNNLIHVFREGLSEELKSGDNDYKLDTINQTTTYTLKVGGSQDMVLWDSETVGESGISPYRISLDEDSVFVPSDNDGTVGDFEYPLITPRVLHELTKIEDWKAINKGG
jgi:hypothetical protein